MTNQSKRIKIIYSLTSFLIAIAVFMACKKTVAETDKYEWFTTQLISFSPASAAQGDTLFVTGRFGDAAEKATVKIGEKNAIVSSTGSGIIQVVIPHGAKSGKINISMLGQHVSSEQALIISESIPPSVPVVKTMN